MAFKHHILIQKEEYLERLKSPEVWLSMALYQKKIADALIDKIVITKDVLDTVGTSDEFVIMKINALYHYGIGIENGLKALLILNNPNKIVTKVNGGEVLVTKIGTKSHNLRKLAEESGILDVEVFKNDAYLIDVLEFLSEVVLWFARYPVGITNTSDFVISPKTPFVCVYGWHILDVINPLFDYFKEKM